MRRQIKALARDLLIERGYRGVSFGDIATALDTTRANIHYHFGNKHMLVEEVLEDYVEETLDGLNDRLPAGRPAADRQDRGGRRDQPPPAPEIQSDRQGHRAVEPDRPHAPGQRGADAEGTRGARTLRAGARRRASPPPSAPRATRASSSRSMPVEDVALQLVSIANSAGPITQDAGDFDRLEQLYLAFGRIVQHAYGKPRGATAVRADHDAPRKRGTGGRVTGGHVS